MRMIRSGGLALAGVCLAGAVQASNYANSVINYSPGTGHAVEFGTGIGYTNPAAALGPPAITNDFGAITPFNSPYSRNDLVSLGVGGSLTIGFGAPIQDNAGNPFGLDFIIFGSAAFIDADFPNGRTDGSASMFSQNDGVNPGTTRVWVSANNVSYFELDPTKAPVVDGLFPADGTGDPSLPVDPSLRNSASLANKTLAELGSLYNGSAGGTGYDIGWAIDTNGVSVVLPEITFVRIDVLQNRSEIDAFGAVVPEPGTWALGLVGTVWLWAMRRRRLK